MSLFLCAILWCKKHIINKMIEERQERHSDMTKNYCRMSPDLMDDVAAVLEREKCKRQGRVRLGRDWLEGRTKV